MSCPAAKNYSALMSTEPRWRDPSPHHSRASSEAPPRAWERLPEREVSLCQGGRGQPATVVTEAGSSVEVNLASLWPFFSFSISPGIWTFIPHLQKVSKGPLCPQLTTLLRRF